ncbi:glycerophosphoryl diester phosphodiesterase [Flavobacterium cutihirudinis]|uniref:Glycerophosphoryl diester phosphodiesterase n=1 Tax=Flavobacterium cutihirudinis TaxID=1265740 RepID=A0A3D9FKA9_9FLAO|nr:glycerophosphodiester phosphodiesterase family protein [Flavobacterium cutihirudinis]RED19614.1 glycerophosphoryl diester phosphodiesterase [Flavobacterium cutihirudinis]
MKYFYFFFFIILFTSCEASENSDQEPPLPESLPETISNKWYEKGKDSIKIIAHGGASAYEPFNSLRAFKKAFELHADAIELDLMNSKDDSIMVFHDLNTKRYTGADYNVVQTSANALRRLDIGNGEKMPFLTEVFEVLPKGKKIYLEIKWWEEPSSRRNANLLNKLIGQIEKSGRAEDCVIVCLDFDYLIRIKMKKPNIKCFLTTYDKDLLKKVSLVLPKYNIQGCSVMSNLISSDLSESLKVNNVFLFGWTIDDGNLALDVCKKYKVNGIYTNKPDIIWRSLNELKK